MSMQLTTFATSDGNNKAENQNSRDCCEKSFMKVFSGDFWPCLSQAKFEKLMVAFTFRAETRTLIAWVGGCMCIVLDVLVYNIAVYFYEFSSILTSTQGSGISIDINISGLPARMFFTLKFALSVENNED